MVIIGGLGSITGAGLGAFFLFGTRRLLEEALGDPVWIGYAVAFAAGAALITVLTKAPGGLAGLFFFPRDPVVRGIVWHDEESRGSEPTENGQRSVAADDTGPIPAARTRTSARS
jgi:hypothetical protein